MILAPIQIELAARALGWRGQYRASDPLRLFVVNEFYVPPRKNAYRVRRVCVTVTGTVSTPVELRLVP
jgi:hypothetical protein